MRAHCGAGCEAYARFMSAQSASALPRDSARQMRSIQLHGEPLLHGLSERLTAAPWLSCCCFAGLCVCAAYNCVAGKLPAPSALCAVLHVSTWSSCGSGSVQVVVCTCSRCQVDAPLYLWQCLLQSEAIRSWPAGLTLTVEGVCLGATWVLHCYQGCSKS